MSRLGHAFFACLLAAAASLRAGALRADGPVGAEQSHLPADENASAPEQEALVLLERAKELFREGRFREAAPLLQRAYALTRAPRYLFNLGVVHHQLSECEPAREYFERYLQEEPSGSATQQATWALEELYSRCPERASPSGGPAIAPETQAPRGAGPPKLSRSERRERASEPARAPSVAAEPPRAGPSVRDWVLLGAGAGVGLAAILSLTMQSRAQSDLDALWSRASEDEGAWDSYELERQALSDNAHLYRGLSIAFGLGFAALAGTGTTLWLIERASEPGVKASAGGFPGVSYQTRF